MIRSLRSLFFIGLIYTVSVHGQNFDQYKTLTCSGTMPDDFRYLGSEKFHRELEILQSNGTGSSSAQRNFALESSFAISELISSGRVLYGDPLSEYFRKVAAVILNDNKDLLNKLRFYTIKSTHANAFCTQEGIIFITTGLLAQIENEAQLGFVIAHEITHYLEKHVFEQYKKRQLLLNNADRNATVSIEDKLKSLCRYSKNHELEADGKGMDLLLKTRYNPYAAPALMDVLLYSYLPFDVISWDPSVFETDWYKFPVEYSEFKISDISADENEEDGLSLHPNISRRKSALYAMIEKTSADSTGKKRFIVSESEFFKNQRIARYEQAALYLLAGNPVRAYYISYLLEKTYGSGYYTDKVKAFSLYSLAHHRFVGDGLETYGCNPKLYEGEIQMVPYFLKKIKKSELTILACRVIWEISEKYPADPQLERMRNQLFQELRSHKSIQLWGFKKFSASKDTGNATGSKVDKIKGRKKASKYESYYYGAFVDLLKNKKFEAMLSAGSDGAEPSEEPEYEEGNPVNVRSKRKSPKKVNDNIPQKVILFKPEYTSIKNRQFNPVFDELQQHKLMKYYQEEAALLQLELAILNPNEQADISTEAFNQYAALNDWLLERLNNDTTAMELYQRGYLNDLMRDWGTQYLGWAGFFNKNSQYSSLLLLYHVESGKPVSYTFDTLNKKPDPITLRAIIFHQLKKIKYGY